MRKAVFRSMAATIVAVPILSAAPDRVPQSGAPHNLILFVPDGLRAAVVAPELTPAMAAVRDRGVNFANPHAVLPTVTMTNGSALATGHDPGDSGVYGNALFTGLPLATASRSVTPFIESDPILTELNGHFGGDFLNETTVTSAARLAGYSTAVVGKLGPTLLFDHNIRAGAATIVIDDQTGTANGMPLTPEIDAALKAAGLPVATPARGDNGVAGTFETKGTVVANVAQQEYFVDVVTKVVLPLFKTRGKPFFLMFWSRDPDGTQHNQGDSLNQLTPGINGPTSRAAIANADSNLGRIRRAVEELGLTATTNLVVSADHGFSTGSKQSQTSPSARMTFADVPRGFLPPGFLTLDLAAALSLPVFDPDNANVKLGPGQHPLRANGLLGADPSRPEVVIASNGGNDLIYLPGRSRALARRIVDVLLAADYVSGIFVDSALGSFAGTLPLRAINLEGASRTPRPSIVVGFRSAAVGCATPLLCATVVVDTTLQQGQGWHGSFSRADTANFMAAIGPAFKTGFVSDAPASNADVGRTLMHLLQLPVQPRGGRLGRVLTEVLAGGRAVSHTRGVRESAASANGLRTRLNFQQVGSTLYFDAAGFAGRTIGLQ